LRRLPMRYTSLMKLQLASLAALLLMSACSEPQVPAETVACRDSQEGFCQAPLCMMDEAGSCRFCRCFEPLEDQTVAQNSWRGVRRPPLAPPNPIVSPLTPR
jgi:hypothetical protein